MQTKKQYVLFTLLIALLTVSCTEKIAEELKNIDNQESATDPGTSTPKGMRVVNTMIEGFSHLLHKEGAKSTACEVIAPTGGWKAENYFKADTTVAVDCVLDVEEQDLFRYGAKMKFSVDEGMCEYVTYEPLKFMRYQPGKTVRKEYQVGCDSVCGELNPDFCEAESAKTYKTYNGVSTLLDSGTNVSYVAPFENELGGQLQKCEFDYSLNGEGQPNCDIGSITTYKYNYTSYEHNWCDGGEINLRSRASESDCTLAGLWEDNGSCTDGTYTTQSGCEDAAETWTPNFQCDVVGRMSEAQCVAAGTWRPLDCLMNSEQVKVLEDGLAKVETACGGDTLNCLEGPGARIAEDASKIGIMWTNEDLSPITQEVTVDSPDELEFYGNRYAASYSRVCANDDAKINYGTALFKGHEVETIQSILSYTARPVDSDRNGVNDYLVYADSPFSGVGLNGSATKYWVKGYYAFNCLDKSKDVKAQIRLHIRDWDREFTKNSAFLDLVSDYDFAGTSLMDNNGIHDDDQFWNDHSDWDDFFQQGIGFCSNKTYFNQAECEANDGTWSSGNDMFLQNNCRDLNSKPTDGTCSPNGVDDLSKTTRTACETTYTKCTLAGVAVAPIQGTKSECKAQNSANDWDPSPWKSSDESYKNFIGPNL